ncbi:MAG: glycoside hydrolase family 15 protein, partial [Chloroflexi bacterium]|nr:glycoside hydrolase family 15 protein [Chloroflexota bacterium]
MPRDLALGNGSFLVNFDSRYRVRDIYYPRVGSENQTGGRACRFGVGVDGQFSWISNDEWSRDLDYADNTLATDVRLRNSRLGVELVCADAVDFDRPIFVRRVAVRNLADHERTFTLYFHADFWLERDGIGDTAYFDPWTEGIVHYKRNVNFLCNAQVGDKVGFDEYSVGGKSEDASQGTWLDA